jgi:PKD repeat protein
MKKAISAQKTKMYLENPDAPAAASGLLRNVSKSQPAVAIFDNVSNLRSGAGVYVIGTGFSSIDGQSWVLQNIDPETKSAELANSDTSNENGDFSANAAWVLHAYIDVCAVSYQVNQNTAADIDTTTLCDDEKTSLVGFSDPGTLTFDFFIDPTDPDYQALRDAQKDGEVRLFEIVYRNKAVRTLPVIVQNINESGGVDQAVQGSATLKITGPDVLTMPPGEQTPNYVLIPVATPQQGTAPLDVTLTLNEAGGQGSAFKIDWKDDSPVTATASHQAVHTYQKAGQYQPTVIATVAGSETAPFKSQTIVNVQRLPYSAAALVEPNKGDFPLDVTLTITETNGPADSFLVDWGDGSIAQAVTELESTHIYAAAGNFSVLITPKLDGIEQEQITPAPSIAVTDPDAAKAIDVEVTDDNAVANGVAQNRVIVMARNANGDPVEAEVTISVSTATAYATFNEGNTTLDGLVVNITDPVAEPVTVTVQLKADASIAGEAEVTFVEAGA